ncbi:MAG TPA: hypothetical protein PK156_33240 [Polyangium sp.]|nr:hypothetical protein [Polyangium sp.]
MGCRWFVCMLVSLLASCSGSREPLQETPVIALQSPSAHASASAATASSKDPVPPEPSAAPAMSTVAERAAPSASAFGGPPLPYPENWILRARGDNSGRSCSELVYKNGCSQTRTGIVTFDVTIDDDGSVVKFVEINNQIRNDKALVSQCLQKNLPNWKFHPPEGHEKTFRLPVALSDKC